MSAIEGEQLNSGVNESEVSQEPQDLAVDNSNQESPTPDKNVDKPTPFHEHPRWKEVMSQREADQNRLRELEEQLSQFKQASTPKPVDPSQKLVERLKGIDPEFGKWAEEQEAARREYQELKQWKQQMETEKLKSTAESQMSQLATQYKVPKELEPFYRAQIQTMAMSNPKLPISALPQLYKQVHEQLNSYLENVRRSEREQYVTGKKQDAKIPASQPKGKPAPAQKEAWSGDPEERQRKMITEALKIIRSQKPENI